MAPHGKMVLSQFPCLSYSVSGIREDSAVGPDRPPGVIIAEKKEDIRAFRRSGGDNGNGSEED
jgi:hypothetical protein